MIDDVDHGLYNLSETWTFQMKKTSSTVNPLPIDALFRCENLRRLTTRLCLVVCTVSFLAGCAVPPVEPEKTDEAAYKTQLSWRGQQGFERYRESGVFKAFAFDPYGSKWWYTYGVGTPQRAINIALRNCGKDERKCEFYAVGNTVVAGMSLEQLSTVIEQYKERDGPGGPSDQSAREEGFRAYLKLYDEIHYKVFVAAKEGAWAYQIRETLDSALQKAMKACKDHVTVVNNTGRCRVYAVGSTNVWDMSEKEGFKHIEAYSQDPLADYSLLYPDGFPR